MRVHVHVRVPAAAMRVADELQGGGGGGRDGRDVRETQAVWEAVLQRGAHGAQVVASVLLGHLAGSFVFFF